MDGGHVRRTHGPRGRRAGHEICPAPQRGVQASARYMYLKVGTRTLGKLPYLPPASLTCARVWHVRRGER